MKARNERSCQRMGSLLPVRVLALVLAFHASVAAGTTITDIATDVTDPSDLADTEPSIAVNPANPLEIAVVTFSDGLGPGVIAPISRSVQGSATLTKQM